MSWLGGKKRGGHKNRTQAWWGETQSPQTRAGAKPSHLRQRRLQPESLETRSMMAAGDPFDVLVFSRTTGFRHDSIDEGIQAVQALGQANNFTVVATEDPAVFTDAGLARYEVIVFLNTTGDVLNGTQQAAMERYIRDGGGFLGTHSSADTEYGWAWYGQLVGAYFDSHPAIQSGTVIVADSTFPGMSGLPERWTRTDEWYNYRANPRSKVHVLATLDEKTYSGGNMGIDHPIAWAQEFDGGRSFYTGLGHTAATYGEPLFRQHLLGGLQWAAGVVQGDAGASLEKNFRVVPLDENTDNPMELAAAPNGDIYYVERGGNIKVYAPELGQTQLVGRVAVTTSNEDGLLGIALDPNFATNGWLYLFYSAPTPNEQHVSRFTVENRRFVARSEKILLRIPTQRSNCCHSAGSLAFGPDGLLYISTGDNTNPFASDGYGPNDERAGRSDWDAQKSSGNRNDLRGKILRIDPQDDGTATIPPGNLFPADGSNGRPEVFVMGNRNPFRITVDQKTGWLYWGEVGPDAGSDSNRGPRGYDEINQARAAGNYGWPYFVGDNYAYADYNFATQEVGALFNPNAPVNNSPNNTGSQQLPAAQRPLIWYPYGNSTEFPELGSGGRTAMAGPVFYRDGQPGSNVALPDYYDNTLFIYEWSRNWIKEVKLDQDGKVLKINAFLPSQRFARPMDMTIGADGAIYMLEWGTQFGGGNGDSRLIRIEYLRQSNPPAAVLRSDVDSGSVPLLVRFDGSRSTPGAFGPLTFAWDFDGDGTVDSQAESPEFTYTEAGSYQPTLTVTDSKGTTSKASVSVVAGNNRPRVSLSYPLDGTFFTWGESVPFEVSVEDEEDGSTAGGQILGSSVVVQPLLGHDTHAHPLNEINSLAGTFVAPAGHGDGGDNLFLLVEGRYVDQGNNAAGPLTGTTIARLNPHIKQAEHYTQQQGVSLLASTDPEGGGSVVKVGQAGNFFSFGHINLQNIDRIRFRAAGAATGAGYELRLDAPDGAIISSGQITPSAAGTFTNVVRTVTNPGGLHELFFVFTGSNSSLANLVINYVDFFRVTNPAPTAVADRYIARGNLPLQVGAGAGVLSNDTDRQNDVLFAVLKSEPAQGTLALSPSGAFVYTPLAGYFGQDSFTYAAHDAVRGSVTVTVQIQVNLPGDANGDGIVDLLDFVALRNNFGKSSVNYEQGDFDGDGDVDITDFVLLRNNFGKRVPPAPPGLRG